jgi:hypothetical protein
MLGEKACLLFGQIEPKDQRLERILTDGGRRELLRFHGDGDATSPCAQLGVYLRLINSELHSVTIAISELTSSDRMHRDLPSTYRPQAFCPRKAAPGPTPYPLFNGSSI